MDFLYRLHNVGYILNKKEFYKDLLFRLFTVK